MHTSTERSYQFNSPDEKQFFVMKTILILGQNSSECHTLIHQTHLKVTEWAKKYWCDIDHTENIQNKKEYERRNYIVRTQSGHICVFCSLPHIFYSHVLFYLWPRIWQQKKSERNRNSDEKEVKSKRKGRKVELTKNKITDVKKCNDRWFYPFNTIGLRFKFLVLSDVIFIPCRSCAYAKESSSGVQRQMHQFQTSNTIHYLIIKRNIN